MRTSDQIKEEIIKKFGFLPPFFEPALYSPRVLENLWQQTLLAYLENPIPALFKEKLAAMIARYCAVPYCLVCHTSTLRPLGMTATDVLNLLEARPLSSEELENTIRERVNLDGLRFPLKDWPSDQPELEETILHCCVAIFLNLENQKCHEWLKKILNDDSYNNLIAFIAYNKTCLTWAESHPEVSYEADERYKNNFGHLLDAEPGLALFFSNYSSKVKNHTDQRILWLSEENRRLVENERKVNDELSITINSLKEQEEVIRKFIDALTHDLRNPLAAIKISVQMLLKSESQNPKVNAHLPRVEKHIVRIERMIENLLDASRVRSGEALELKMETSNLEEIAKSVIEDQTLIYGDRFQLESEMVSGLVNPEALKRVIENLISNAVKYGDQTKPITLKLCKQDGISLISVHNFGKELSPENQKSIFDPFYRIGNEEKGWGIGLTIVKSLVEAHGGTVAVESKPTTGTTFILQIPIPSGSSK